MSGLVPDASGYAAIATRLSEAFERGVPKIVQPLPPPSFADRGWANERGSWSCRRCSPAGCDALNVLSNVGFEAIASSNGVGGPKALRATRAGAQITMRASGRVVLATMCTPIATAGLIRIVTQQGLCADEDTGTSRDKAARQVVSRVFDLKWAMPVTSQCMVDIGMICCGGNFTVESLERGGHVGTTKIFGVLHKPMARRCHSRGRALRLLRDNE